MRETAAIRVLRANSACSKDTWGNRYRVMEQVKEEQAEIWHAIPESGQEKLAKVA